MTAMLALPAAAQANHGHYAQQSVRPGSTAGDSKGSHSRRYWDWKYRNLSRSDRGWLYSLRSCESDDGRDEHDPSYSYHGRYQFSLSTASSAGFTLDPHMVYNHEEDVRTIRWRNHSNRWSQWPNCNPW